MAAAAVIDDREILAAVRRAADRANTTGATARMVADEMDFTTVDEIAPELARLERAGDLEGETPIASARWYAEPERSEDLAAADSEALL
jgi:hypothetical protein